MKRWLLRILVFLVLGAIVNVAVAWGFATLMPTRWLVERTGMYMPSDIAEWDICVMAQAGAVLVDAEASMMVTPGPKSQDPIPHWSLPSKIPAQQSPHSEFQEIAYGWPAVTMFYREGCCTWTEGGLVIPWMSRYDDRTLPLMPIWPDFAMNTVFYAIVLCPVFAAAFALRRRWRIRRSLCPKCAYPVGTSDKCTECGAALH